MTSQSETDTKTGAPLKQKGQRVFDNSWRAGGAGWAHSHCYTMFEENPPSSYLTRVAHSEDSQETITAVSHVLQDQENTRPVPVDDGESFAASGDLPANPISPQHRLAKLKLLMFRQKAEYKSKLQGKNVRASRQREHLEQRNPELQLETQDTHSPLGRQRQWNRLVEMKTRNAERAKEDAERRNEMLQKEMEEFFETFGKLTDGIKQECG